MTAPAMWRYYTVVRRTLLSQTFTVRAASAQEARAAIDDLPTSFATEESDDERIENWSQTRAARPTYRVRRQEP